MHLTILIIVFADMNTAIKYHCYKNYFSENTNCPLFIQWTNTILNMLTINLKMTTQNTVACGLIGLVPPSCGLGMQLLLPYKFPWQA